MALPLRGCVPTGPCRRTPPCGSHILSAASRAHVSTVPRWQHAQTGVCHARGRRAAAAAAAEAKQDGELAQLRAEIEALKQALAQAQNVPVDQVTYNAPDSQQLGAGLVDAQPAAETAALPATSTASRQRKQAQQAQPQQPTRQSSADPQQPVEPHRQQPKQLSVADLQQGIRWPSPSEQPPFWDRPPRDSPLTLGGDLPLAPQDPQPLDIVHITAEMAPIAKVGGLGDVVTGLGRACLQRGHGVEVCLPFYECLPQDRIEGLQHDRDFDVPKGRRWDGHMVAEPMRTSAFTGAIAGVPVVLLRPADWDGCNLFRGGRIYGGSYNELEAYLFFCRAALEYLAVSGRAPHIIHLHEWQAAAAAMLFWELYHGALPAARLALTLHNMDSQGECSQEEFMYTGLPGEQFASPDKALDARTIGHNPERLSLLQGGIVYANQVTTVSPTYAADAMGGGGGALRETLGRKDIRAKFRGILNGIDIAEWDPARDTALPAPFCADSPAGKALCKRYLQEGLGLKVDPAAPLVGCITRLVPQKGCHLIRHALFRTRDAGGQAVLLGSGHVDGEFRALAEGVFRDSNAVAIKVMYSDTLAHLIYAAADIVLVPSMFEPCGLTQLVAMRYGALPVVRATGGLADTVFDVDSDSPPPEGQHPNGFTFTGADEASEDSALERAFRYYRERPEWWAEVLQRNMRLDSSWGRSSETYLELYRAMGQA